MIAHRKFAFLIGSILAFSAATTWAALQDTTGGKDVTSNAVTAAQPDQGKAPKIVFENTKVELGKIPDDKPATFQFKFKNEGNAPLMIKMPIRCSCGCTAAKLDKSVYQPGESGTIEAKFNPAGRSGKQHKVCTIHCNDPDNPTVSVTMNAEVMSMVWSDPKSIIATNHPRGQGLSRQVLVQSRADHYEPVSVEVNNPHIKAEILETITIPLTDEHRDAYATKIQVTVDDSAPVGFLNGEVRILVKAWNGEKKTDEDKNKADNDADDNGKKSDTDAEKPRKPKPVVKTIGPDGKEKKVQAKVKRKEQTEELGDDEILLRIPVVVQIVGDLKLQPQQVRLGVFKPMDPIEASFEVISTSGKPFKIEGIDVQSTQVPDMQYEVKYVDNDKVHKAVVKLFGLAPDSPGVIRGRLEIHTNVKGEESKLIPFYGSVRPTQQQPRSVTPGKSSSK